MNAIFEQALQTLSQEMPGCTPGEIVYGYGQVKKSVPSSSKAMVMSGFVSTNDMDLSGEIIDVEAYEQFFPYYQRNALYAYNHDLTIPIGKVMNPHVVKDGVGKQGLYLENITLSAIPIVSDWLWPLIDDEVLTQQSIGFYSLERKVIEGTTHHTLVFVIEGSLVPVACNPQATLDAIKVLTKGAVLDPAWAPIETVDQMMKAYQAGILRPREEIRKTFIMPPTSIEEKKPDFADVQVLSLGTNVIVDMKGQPISRPKRHEKNYAEVADTLFAAKSAVRGSHLFQLAEPTEKGVQYVWDFVALSMGRVLGAQGGFHMSEEQKGAVVGRILEAYEVLGKEAPIVKFNDEIKGFYTASVGDLDGKALSSLDFQQVEWKSGEGEIITTALLENDIQRVKTGLASLSKLGVQPESIKTLVGDLVEKDLWGWVDVSLSASVRDPGAVAFLAQVIQIIQAWLTPDSSEDETDIIIVLDAPEGQIKEPNYEFLSQKFGELAVEQKARVEALKQKSLEGAPAETVKVPVDVFKRLLL